MNIKAKLLGAAMGALGLCGLSSAALAGSTNPPGERAGLDLATPLPEGIYFVNITGVGNWRDAVAGADSNFSYNVPIVAWSTPWNILGGHIQLLVAAPEILAGENYRDPLAIGGRSSFYAQTIYNPFVAGQIAWNFGNGFSASLLSGAYIGISQRRHLRQRLQSHHLPRAVGLGLSWRRLECDRQPDGRLPDRPGFLLCLRHCPELPVERLFQL